MTLQNNEIKQQKRHEIEGLQYYIKIEKEEGLVSDGTLRSNSRRRDNNHWRFPYMRRNLLIKLLGGGGSEECGDQWMCGNR